MCLAIYKPKGSTILEQTLRSAFYANNDGAGFAVAKGNHISIYKGFFKFDEFYKAYRGFENDDCIIHFRIATHGAENKANCHPFPLCGGQYALIHNGVLPIDTKSNPDKSDTNHFASLVMTPMLHRVEFDHPAFKFLIETAIGSGNKLIVMRADGECVIYNEEEGHWLNGSWFSNRSYGYYAGIGFNASSAWESDWTPEGIYNKKGEELTNAELKEMFPDWEPISKIPLLVNTSNDAQAWLDEKEAEHEAELAAEVDRKIEEQEAILELQEEFN